MNNDLNDALNEALDAIDDLYIFNTRSINEHFANTVWKYALTLFTSMNLNEVDDETELRKMMSDTILAKIPVRR